MVPSSQVLDKFIVQEKLIEDRSSSDISMGTEALDRFMLLWERDRGFRSVSGISIRSGEVVEVD